jgi:hypothetical protein
MFSKVIRVDRLVFFTHNIEFNVQTHFNFFYTVSKEDNFILPTLTILQIIN